MYATGQMKEGDFWIRESSMQPHAIYQTYFQIITYFSNRQREAERKTGKGSPACSAQEGGERCITIREGRLQWTSTPEGLELC